MVKSTFRLAGAALVAPVINYRWPRFPKDLSKEAYYQQAVGDQWLLRVAYYAPWLLNWWVNQSWLPSPTVIQGNTFLPNHLDSQFRDRAISSGIFHQVIMPYKTIHYSLNTNSHNLRVRT